MRLPLEMAAVIESIDFTHFSSILYGSNRREGVGSRYLYGARSYRSGYR